MIYSIILQVKNLGRQVLIKNYDKQGFGSTSFNVNSLDLIKYQYQRILYDLDFFLHSNLFLGKTIA
jgi:hypothetical protein